MISFLQTIEDYRLFDIKLVNPGDLVELAVRFAFNFLVIHFLVSLVYNRGRANSKYSVSYYMFGVLVFLVIYLLSNVDVTMGFAFGLFAVFSIIRYRTSMIPVKEMTYLFAVITISMINALITKKISYAEILLTNFFVVFAMYMLDGRTNRIRKEIRSITYDNIELTVADRKEELIADLRSKTGWDIMDVKVKKINYVRDTADITVYVASKTF